MTAPAAIDPIPLEPVACLQRSEHLRDQLLFARLRVSGDRRAREALVERFLPLAHSVARRYRGPGEGFDDLVQVASLGLLKAIDRYEPGRGVAFTSYAVPTIAGEIKRYFRDRTWTVRPPRDLQELTLRLDDATSRLSRVLDRAPTVAELASDLDRDEEQILEALQASRARHGLSLQAPGGAQDDRSSLEETLYADDDPIELADLRILRDWLVRGLSDRNREILRLRFEEDLTQQEIGELMGISQMQVSRLIRQSVQKLREIVDEPVSPLPV